ncbi:MAG: transpeptidase family protein [Bacteroidetes bacterium]|nr:transpeptidase family protein [Bacteroidota bacterium]
MEDRKDILWRIYLIYISISIFAIAIITKVCIIQFKEGEYWKEKAQSLTTAYKKIDAVRGNIFDVDGSMLATSLPYYEVGMDVNTDYLSDELFKSKVDSLALCLSNLFKDRTSKEYYRLLVGARKQKDRYVLLKKDVSYKELQQLKKFPLFKLGRYKGGLLYVQTNKRERPFKYLAARTIGYDRIDAKPIGIEGAFNNYLQGISGQRLMQKIAGGVWMPINNTNEVEPEDGCDIITTIDINIQDVAENALHAQLLKQNAGYGCVVLMEVATGEIRAIANLTRQDSGKYTESFNYAIGAATEPGSTFKLATLAAAMEDGYIDITDTIDIGNGSAKFYDLEIKDSHHPEKSRVSVKEIFEQSSNVGVAKIAFKYYAKNPQKFIDRLGTMGLTAPLKISIPGEAMPRIKNTSDKDWYGTTLPSMSRGYELMLTPLHILAFYNAFANNGIMVRPQFVKEILKEGQSIKKFERDIINPSVASKSTIEQARRMMEGVVSNGTAKNLKAASYRIAGKTGTAQIAKREGGYGKNKTGGVTYQASFVGYFPAENPKYSCIVVVNAPSNNVYYGNVVAGPIFREIADKVYSTSFDIHQSVNDNQKFLTINTPFTKSGNRKDIDSIYSVLKCKTRTALAQGDWVAPVLRDSTIKEFTSNVVTKDLKRGVMPNLTGMMAKDVVYLLENRGMHVRLKGKGVIVKQSIEIGKKINKGILVELELS